jgi:N-acylneuraminate cytidylyltransferase
LGKPIIQYSIECALNANIFDKIIISTDDYEVANLATSLGIPTSPDRPSTLSDDVTSIVDVLRYEIDNNSLADCSSVTLLFACAPLIEPSDLIAGTKKFESQSACSSMMTISHYPVPIEWAMSIAKGEVIFDKPQLLATSSADLEDKYFDAGQFYIYHPKGLQNMPTGLITKGILPFVIPPHKAVDIDNLEDWKFAEKLFSAQFNL